MWVDDQGVCHTVALPDPTELMSDVFRHSLDQLMVRGQEDLDEVIEVEQMRFFEERAGLLLWDSEEAEFVRAAPPLALLAERMWAHGPVGPMRVTLQMDGISDVRMYQAGPSLAAWTVPGFR